MKTKLQISNETKQAIQTWINLSNKFKGSYFWKSLGNAGTRRSMEAKNTLDYESDGIKLHFSITCSCKNVYVNKSVEINGKLTNATALKKFLK